MACWPAGAAVEETCQGEKPMKFSAVVLIVPDEDENRAVEILKEAGATGITILKGKGCGTTSARPFSVWVWSARSRLLLCVVEKQLAMRILRAVKMQMKMDLPGGGLAFSLPLGSVVGIGLAQMQAFRREVEEDL
jgi:nitrogen regulatory protein PII